MHDITWQRADQDNAWETGAIYLAVDQTGERGIDAPFFTVTVYDTSPDTELHLMEILFSEDIAQPPSLVFQVEVVSVDVAVATALRFIGAAMLHNLSPAIYPSPVEL